MNKRKNKTNIYKQKQQKQDGKTTTIIYNIVSKLKHFLTHVILCIRLYGNLYTRPAPIHELDYNLLLYYLNLTVTTQDL
jgi:hypothetical protein